MDYHHNLTSSIKIMCETSHKCIFSRKLCVECQYEHEVDMKHTIPTTKFRDLVIQEIEQSYLEKPLDIEQQRMSFNPTLSKIFDIFKEIFNEISQTIEQIFDMIEQENNKYLKLIAQNKELAQSPYTKLEKLFVQLEGNELKGWDALKNSTLFKLQHKKEWLEKVEQAFSDKMRQEFIDNVNQQKKEEIPPPFQQKENFAEILAALYNFDGLLNNLIRTLKKLKTTDCIRFFSNRNSQQLIEVHFHQNNLYPNHQFDIQYITNVLKHIQDLDFFQKNLSLNEFEVIRKRLITHIIQQQNEKEVDFLKILIHLPAIDNQLIQSVSNSLNLLVELRADQKDQSFADIRLKAHSLIQANFAHSNLSGTEFNNLDINGMILNDALLFNYKQNNLRVSGEQDSKLDGHTGAVLQVCFSPDRTTLASGSCDKSILLWDVQTGQKKKMINGHTQTIRSVCFSPDGATLASGSYDNSICLWDAETGQLKVKLDGHTAAVFSVNFSPDGTILASGSDDMSIRLWDVMTGKQNCVLNGHINSVNCVSFSPDGTILASGSRDKSIRLWDVKTEKQKRQFDGHSSLVYSVCFSADGTTLASGSRDKSIRLWDVKTGQQKGQLNGHNSAVWSISFNPDSTTLASSSDDGSIHLWNVNTGKQKRRLNGHTSLVYSVTFSSDGTTLAAGSEDKSISLWDVKTGHQKGKLYKHKNVDNSICFFPDSTILASGSDDKIIRLLELKTCNSIQTTDNRYKTMKNQMTKKDLNNFNQYFGIHLFLTLASSLTGVRITESLLLQDQEAPLLNGEFINHKGQNLQSLLQSKQSVEVDRLFDKK